MVVFEEGEGATMISVLGLKMRENSGSTNRKKGRQDRRDNDQLGVDTSSLRFQCDTQVHMCIKKPENWAWVSGNHLHKSHC